MTNDEILYKAKYCLNCANPLCKRACPLNMKIPEFIDCIKKEKFDEAQKIIMEKSFLGSICGRVCPHNKQCEGSCIRGIKEKPVSIGELEACVCDRNFSFEINNECEGLKVAIIGSGPAGLECAARLRSKGASVTIFEKEKKLGGILTYGIPNERLAKDIVENTINNIVNMGIDVKYSSTFGIDYNIDDLKSAGYDAIFLGIGAEKSKMLNIDGSNLKEVYGANEFLREQNVNRKDKVIVVGGGNVAMDTASVAMRKGASVCVIYRRRREDMPANLKEIETVEKLGADFIFEENIISILGNNKVEQIKTTSGKLIDADKVIMAIGSNPNLELLKDFEISENGFLKVNEFGETSISNVYAGGDLVQSKATVCMAIKTANDVADRIINIFKKEKIKICSQHRN